MSRPSKILLTASLLLMSLLTTRSDAQETSVISQSKQMEQSARIAQAAHHVMDFAQFDFKQLFVKSDRPWVLGIIGPSFGSGAIIPKDQWIDRWRDLPPLGPQDQETIVVQGFIHVLAATASGLEGQLFPYRFALANKSEVVNNPFMTDGYALFRLASNSQNYKETLPVCQIPSGWEQFVVPAMDYYQEHSQVFETKQARRNQKALESLLENPNPLMTILACRTLSDAKLLNLSMLRESLTQVRDEVQGVRKSACLWLLLERAPETASPDVVVLLTKLAASTKGASYLKWIVMWTSTAAYTQNQRIQEMASTVLAGINSHPETFKENTTTSKYIDAVLKEFIKQSR